MSNIFVTGAAGCLGSSLVRRLVREGHDIHILVQPNTWHPYLDGLNLKVFVGDIRRKKDVLKAMDGCDYVYQVAGVVSYNILENRNMFTTHVYGVKNVLEAAKALGVKKVVVTASTAGIGIPEDASKPLNEHAPFDFKKYKKVMYMYSKYHTIQLCKKFADEGLNVCVACPTTFYGQGDITMHIGKVVKKIKQGKMKVAPPGGNAVVAVDDVVDAHLLLMERGVSGEHYIFASEFIPYIDMFNRIARLMNAKPVKKVTPAWILPYAKFVLSIIEHTMALFGKKPLLSPRSLNFSFKYRYYDPSKAIKEIGWRPRQSFEEAMIKAIGFYEEYGLI